MLQPLKSSRDSAAIQLPLSQVLLDEYYAAQKGKRQGLGLVRLIKGLFRLNMFTKRIMQECIKKLLSNIETPQEEDIESLSRLMRLLNHKKAISHMNFSRMQIMSNCPNLSSHFLGSGIQVNHCQQQSSLLGAQQALWQGRSVGSQQDLARSQGMDPGVRAQAGQG
ncbi:uncharacterized protein VP01_148g27 [Puccinia sorghi]|uniref:Uncharacterized protein n=1 Tax=Puccinia sorghi TaxID=27349 RepID=A0A0L6VL99_9BASI|nr:uncharacterized protein VP01_148g27 [Puccinia sorghi]